MIAAAKAPAPRSAVPLRAAWRMLRIGLHIGWGLSIVTLRFPRLAAPQRVPHVQRWAAGVLRILGVQIEQTHGSAPPRAALVVANHVSWLDIVVLLAAMPQARFVSKDEVVRWPLIGTLVAAAGTVFIRRGDARSLRAAIDAMGATLAAGALVAVFPEGTTSDGIDVLPFSAGVLEAAVRARVPVQPVALRYSDANGPFAAAPVYVGDTSFAQSLWRVAASPALRVMLAQLPALPAQGADRRELAHRARSAIRAALAH